MDSADEPRILTQKHKGKLKDIHDACEAEIHNAKSRAKAAEVAAVAELVQSAKKFGWFVCEGYECNVVFKSLYTFKCGHPSWLQTPFCPDCYAELADCGRDRESYFTCSMCDPPDTRKKKNFFFDHQI